MYIRSIGLSRILQNKAPSYLKYIFRNFKILSGNMRAMVHGCLWAPIKRHQHQFLRIHLTV